MYERTYWVDHVVDQNGKVIQQGTLLDQLHHNKMEAGISDAALAHAIRTFAAIQQGFEMDYEVQKLSLNCAANGGHWPFNNAESAVALEIMRNNTDYTVDIDVTAYSGGGLGNIHITDKALNGFKVCHDGSATAVEVTLKIRGGMTA